MKIKKEDYLFIFIFISIILILVIPFTRNNLENSTENYPYILGFIKTSILATYGDLLANRISTGKYFNRKGIFYRFIIWGILGMVFVLVFKIFAEGVNAAISSNLLPSIDKAGTFKSIYTAFMISLIMNIIFAPTFMIFHRITDTFIDLKNNKIKNISLDIILDKINWKQFFNFVIFKTIPFFWIPAHTITFLLPENYRVLMAGFLSIALGLILTFSKLKSQDNNNIRKI